MENISQLILKYRTKSNCANTKYQTATCFVLDHRQFKSAKVFSVSEYIKKLHVSIITLAG